MSRFSLGKGDECLVCPPSPSRPGWLWLLLLGAVLIWVSMAVMPVSAAPGSDTPGTSGYLVQPGDSLVILAQRFGLSVRALMRLNGLRHPRQLYPGQVLRIPDVTIDLSQTYFVEGEDAMAWLGRWAELEPEVLARRNGLLRMVPLVPGVAVRLPVGTVPCAVPLRSVPWLKRAPRVGGAIWSGRTLAAVLQVNPYPLPSDATLILPPSDNACPEVHGESRRDSMLQTWSLRPQPVTRGEVAVLMIETGAPISSCHVAYLDRSEPCYTGDAPSRQWVTWLGISPLVEPGLYPVTVTFEMPGGPTEVASFSLAVAAGHYDYERIDLPADRQALLDPQRTRLERLKIAELRERRTSERFWTMPFLRPVEAPVTSYYGSRRSYGAGFTSYHAGVDFRAQVGEPVSAPAAGQVVLAEPLVVRGRAVVIDHGWGIVSGFWHLSAIEVSVGEWVSAGQRVGQVGNTGLSTGPHLHWELWVNGVAVNPLSWVDPESALVWEE